LSNRSYINVVDGTCTFNQKDLSKKSKSFNDINIIPVLTNIKSENEISFSTKITKNTSLLTPIVSLSTNIQNIINLNLLGGLGIFNNDNLQNQIQFINTVKNYLKYIDETPITIYSNATYTEIKNTFFQYSPDYIAVIDESNTFLGFITYTYFNLVSVLDNNICANQIMIPLEILKFYKTYDYNWNNLLTERPPIDIITNLKTFQFIPIICDNKKLQGVITLKNFTLFYTYRNKALVDKNGKLITAISTGIYPDSLDRIGKLVSVGLDFIFIRLDNGYNNCLVNIIKDIKHKFHNLKIIIGNIHSSNAFKYLCEAGADSISLGDETEFGQFTLLQECFALSKIYDVPIINNSGIPTQNKNIFKAFAAGCNSILIPNDSTFNHTIEDVLEFIKNGLISLNIIDINHLHSTYIEYVITN
jgi:IMP dehydrogenase / GMP reductase domain.